MKVTAKKSRKATTQFCGCRQNQELQQDSLAMHEQQLRLQEEAQGLAQRLEVVLHDKFQHHHNSFDSDTPIDKTLTLLEGVIGVRLGSLSTATSSSVAFCASDVVLLCTATSSSVALCASDIVLLCSLGLTLTLCSSPPPQPPRPSLTHEHI